MKEYPKNPFNFTWTIKTVAPGEDGTFKYLPMDCDDKLKIDVREDGLVSFERTCKNGTTDPAWAAARGVYNETTGEIVGQVLKDEQGDLKTQFLIKAEEGNHILGIHRYNPGGGEWGGGDPD